MKLQVSILFLMLSQFTLAQTPAIKKVLSSGYKFNMQSVRLGDEFGVDARLWMGEVRDNIKKKTTKLDKLNAVAFLSPVNGEINRSIGTAVRVIGIEHHGLSQNVQNKGLIASITYRVAQEFYLTGKPVEGSKVDYYVASSNMGCHDGEIIGTLNSPYLAKVSESSVEPVELIMNCDE